MLETPSASANSWMEALSFDCKYSSNRFSRVMDLDAICYILLSLTEDDEI
jgi:hypothetical protein